MALAGLALHGWVVRRPGLPGDVIRWAARLAGWPGRRAGPRWARLLGGLGPDQMALALTLVLGLAVVVLAGLGVGALVDDVTEGDGVAALGHPVARFVAAHRSAARTSVMKAVSVAGGPAWMTVGRWPLACCSVRVGIADAGNGPGGDRRGGVSG